MGTKIALPTDEILKNSLYKICTSNISPSIRLMGRKKVLMTYEILQVLSLKFSLLILYGV